MAVPEKYAAGDPWQSLKTFTPARIALGRAGTGLPLKQWLQFKMAHAHARDAVYSVLQTEKIVTELEDTGLAVLLLNSQATGRDHYLQRPDLGRRLQAVAAEKLQTYAGGYDIVFVVADGLSATAANHHAAALIKTLLPLFREKGFTIAPVCLVQQGRVAVGDDIGTLLQAKLVLLLIGERPGLSSPDSLGVYITYKPVPGLTDESRNCISNIHAAGLSIAVAAQKINYLVTAALRLQLSGVHLKDESELLHE